jgi:hypothetical protein
MLFHLSSTNLAILAVGSLLVLANVLASSRLAPLLAGFFARYLGHRAQRTAHPLGHK